MDENEAALVAEQIRHGLDMLRADLQAVQAAHAHHQALVAHRLEALETQARDHETRLRAATDGVVQFKVWSGLASGGSGLISLAALIKSFFAM